MMIIRSSIPIYVTDGFASSRGYDCFAVFYSEKLNMGMLSKDKTDVMISPDD